MVWDKSNPAGNTKVSVGDDAIRANNDALEAALTAEHAFATGDDQSGRHRFPRGSIAQLTALAEKQNSTPGASIGYSGIGISMDARTLGSLVYWDGTAWQYADPGVSDIARIDETGNWTAPQNIQWVQVTPAAGTPDTLAVDMSLSPNKYATITGDTLVSNPTNVPAANYGHVVTLDLTMSGAGHAITWGTNYRSSFGVSPIVDDADGAVNIFSLVYRRDGTVLVSAAPGVDTF